MVRRPQVSERRNVDPAGDVRGIRRIVDRILGQQCRVSERRRTVDDGVEFFITGVARIFSSPVSCATVMFFPYPRSAD